MEPERLESLYPEGSREKEISELLSFIKQGKSVQLVGLPGAGRGNLLGMLAYDRNLRTQHLGKEGYLQYHFVLCNLSEMKKRPLFDVIKFLFLELASSLHERNREEEFTAVDKRFKDALSYQDELVLFQALKESIDYLTLERNITIILMLERFEVYIPLLTDIFFTNLRSIRNRAKYKFSVVFSVTRPLEDTLEPDILSDFYEYVAGNYVYLSLLDKVGLDFRLQYLEKLTGKKILPKTLAAILSLTSGHGKLTRLALEYALSQDNTEVSSELLLSRKTIQGALEELWRFLTPDEQQDVLHICRDGFCPSPNQFLQKVGLFKNDQIAIPLFQAYVQEKIKFLSQHASFAYDSATNTIAHGATVISDTLTSHEFRLLRLLLEHEGNVVDREAIITAVWAENKTQEGVSEQAVDQLIFRLRKKIEDDPNNPTHIQTIKGRGVKFVQ